MQEVFAVSNVKCGGCVTIICDGLKKLAGITDVEAQVEGGVVTVTGDALSRDLLAAELTRLGYPLAD